MFHLLAKLVTNAWLFFLAAWIALAVGLHRIAPRWAEVATGGQFDSLPADSPSNLARTIFRKAFPEEMTASSIVIVLAREDGPLTNADKQLAERDLRNGLLAIAQKDGGLAAPDAEAARRINLRPEMAPKNKAPEKKSIIARIRTYYDPGSGPLFISADKKATIVIAELTLDLLSKETWPTVIEVEALIEKLRQEHKVPEGLNVALTGSAVIGRDLRKIEAISVKEVEESTVVLVVVLCLIIYRAPILAFIPLLTVGLAVLISVDLLAIMAQRGIIGVSDTTRMYIIVVAFGAGVDYCLFLISRYREELESGHNNKHSVYRALSMTGGALTASAATVAGGIVMLVFAEFRRFHQAGICIPFTLVIVLLGSLTFTPSLLRLARQAAFWPQHLQIVTDPSAPRKRVWDRDLARWFWQTMSRAIVRAPGTIWIASMALMLPFAYIAFTIYNQWDYGIISELPRDTPSRVSSQLVEKHFSPGVTGPIVTLLKNDHFDFGTIEGVQAIGELTKRLERRKEELHLQDIRSVDHPHGISEATAKYRNTLDQESATRPELKNILRQRAIAYYVSSTDPHKRHVTRMDLVFDQDPLSRQSIVDLTRINDMIRSELPPQLQGTEIFFHGATASLRDLADTTSRDLRRIEIYVPAVVLVILVILLLRPFVSIYLIASVIFSYMATLGVAHVFFSWLDPTFTGLDWKVPIFLFTILVAVGEDYNIFLMTRVKEEEEHHGTIEGVKIALVSTGGIISSCGFIMAGTFAALLVGHLVEMKQLGFALAFGVLLDTLVVRPLLVPAFLIMLHRLRTSIFGERKIAKKAEFTPKPADVSAASTRSK